ncbi:MAG: nitroreductase family protein [Chloroflexi bacterium]|nr:nitroreductase family protein [Chloroflexota bacterium]
MHVTEAIRTKRATRQFAATPVPDDLIRQIVDAGRRAQSSKNTQPWHFVVVRDRERMKELSQTGTFASHLAGAAFGVVLASPDPATRWSIPFDVGQAAAYMQLAAWELGVGSCIGSIYEPDKVRALLGLPADQHTYVFLSFGYPADSKPAPARRGGRRAVDDVVHWEQW